MDDNQKAYIHTLKPQIPSVEPRKGRLGSKAIPCVLGEERRINRLWCVFFSVFGCLEERKKWREKLGRREISEKSVLPI